MIEVRDLSLHAGDFRLGPVDLRVEAGEYLVLLGPSGAGKSLLLEALLGFRQLQSGEIRLRDQACAALHARHRRLGWVPQSPTLFPHLSVGDNIAFPLRARRVPAAERRAAVVRHAAHLEATHLLDRSVATLSGGERQRVAVARALASETDILLLDEPFASLEPGSRKRLWSLVTRLHRELNLTILHVTHNVEAARQMPGRVAVMAAGRVIAVGQGEQLLAPGQHPEVSGALGLEMA